MPNLHFLSTSTSSCSVYYNAVLRVLIWGVFITTVSWNASLASVPQSIRIDSEFKIYSDTLAVDSVNSNDRLTIQLGAVHSRLTVWYRPTIERLHEADTTIDFPSAWTLLPSSDWQWNPNTGDWWVRASARDVIYFPIDLVFIYQRNTVEPVLDEVKIREKIRQQIGPVTSPSDELFELEQSGRITRGIVTGTNQQLSLESGLDIQLTGSIGEQTQLSAILTDRNIPFQPDGTTQSIREFDQLIIQVTHPNHALKMGDVDVGMIGAPMHRINRRIQGSMLNNHSTQRKEEKSNHITCITD